MAGKFKVLLTAGGTGSAWQIAKTIDRYYRDRIELYLCDTNEMEMVASSVYSDHFYTVPPVKSKGYAEYMYSLIRENGIDIVIPLIPWEQGYFAEDYKRFHELGIRSTAPLVRTARTLNHKKRLHDFCVECGIPTIRVFETDEIKENDTYFVKKLDGFGSMGAKRIKGADLLAADRKVLDKLVIQEDCTGKGSRKDEPEEVTAECFYDGVECQTVIRERLETKSGVCTKARFRHDEEIDRMVKTFTELLPFPPIFNIQFVRKGNKWLVMDVNLRLAAGTGLSAAAGFDAVRAMLANILGEQVDPEWLKLDTEVKTVLRVYQEVVIK